MGRINSVNTEGISTESFIVKVNFTSSATTNPFVYRLYGVAEDAMGARTYGQPYGELSGTTSVTGDLRVIFQELQAGTTYSYEVYIQYCDTSVDIVDGVRTWHKANDANLTKTGSCTTESAAPGSDVLSLDSIAATSNTSAEVKWTWRPANVSGYWYQGHVLIESNGSVIQTVPSDVQSGSATMRFTVPVSNLSPGASYAITVRMYGGQQRDNLSYTGSQETWNYTQSGDTPAPTGSYLWSWDGETGSWNYGFGNVSSALLQNAYDAITGHGASTDFHHTVWNDMLNCVDMGMTDCGFGTNLGDCYMNTTDKVMTRHRFRSLVNHINALADYAETSRVNSELSSVVRGDTVYGWYFVELMQKYNTAINTIFPM